MRDDLVGYLIGALDAPTSGEIRFRGVPLPAIRDPDRLRAREIGFVFQTFYLLPNLTARENVQMPMFGEGRSDSARVERAETLLKLVGLADRAEAPVFRQATRSWRRVAWPRPASPWCRVPSSGRAGRR